jgi:hypothetical protein
MSNKDEFRHEFSIEMKSKKYVKNITISDRTQDRVVFEGDLGEFESLTLVDDFVLEFIGAYGVLRLIVTEQQLQNSLFEKQKRQPPAPSLGAKTDI